MTNARTIEETRPDEALVLGIETSCDETAAAVVARRADGTGRILSNIVRSQWDAHRAYGGVVPEIAARAHVECLDDIIGAAMAEAGVEWQALSGIAATAGPGLVGGLIVGLFLQLTTLVIPTELKSVGALLVLIVILLVRPYGLLGRRECVG